MSFIVLALTTVRAWWNKKHECPWESDELGRWVTETKASLRRAQKQRRAGRRSLRKAGEFQ
jgi:hypothetical protein